MCTFSSGTAVSGTLVCLGGEKLWVSGCARGIPGILMKIGRLARPQHSGEGLRHAGPASLLDSMTFTSEASLLARQLVRSRSIETPGGRLLDAFVRAPRVASASPAHVVMLGGSLGLAVV